MSLIWTTGVHFGTEQKNDFSHIQVCMVQSKTQLALSLVIRYHCCFLYAVDPTFPITGFTNTYEYLQNLQILTNTYKYLQKLTNTYKHLQTTGK